MTDTFADLLNKVREGDGAAVETLIEEYGSAIRREIRLHLLDSRLKRVVSESDLFQSVISKFLFNLWAGRYEFDKPEALAGFLKTMARARVIDAARHWTAQVRDVRRNANVEVGTSTPGRRPDQTPSQIIANRELLANALNLFSAQEREILELRNERVGWDEIASRLELTSPEAARKGFERAVDRVAGQLELPE